MVKDVDAQVINIISGYSCIRAIGEHDKQRSLATVIRALGRCSASSTVEFAAVGDFATPEIMLSMMSSHL